MKSKLKETAGFTLVELIVVIAVLGILAGVGGVAYAGYIERANEAADKQLVADVEYAVRLGLVTEPDTSGRVSVTPRGLTVSSYAGTGDVDVIKGWLEDAFGTNWANRHTKSLSQDVPVHDGYGLEGADQLSGEVLDVELSVHYHARAPIMRR